MALNDYIDKSTLNLTSFMVNMNAIFERFVTRLVINSLVGTPLRAHPQQSVRAVILEERTGDTYSKIQPDLIIEDTVTGHKVPIDVKYKLYDSEKKISSADIYQSFVYAYSVGAQSETPRAGLVYPATTSISGPALYIKSLTGAKPARIRGAGLAVASVLDAVDEPSHDLLHARIRKMIHEVTDLGEASPTVVAAG